MSGLSRRTLLKSASVLVASAFPQFVPVHKAEGTGAGIYRLEVETWTRTVPYARTDDRIDCVVTFADGRSFQQELNNPGIDDREPGQRDRFNLNLAISSAAAAVAGQTPSSVRFLQLRKVTGTNKWKCEAVGIRVNDVVVLSRYVSHDLENPGDNFTVAVRTDGKLDGLELKLRTGDMKHGETDDSVYCNVGFADGSLLYTPDNLYLNVGEHVNDFERNNAYSNYSYLLPLPSTLNKTVSEIAEIFIRKSGGDGWLLQGAELFANGLEKSAIGNGAINQFLDNTNAALQHTDWSSKSILTPVDRSAHPPQQPLPKDTAYGISGPVLGHMSATVATIVYRVEREGQYRMRLYPFGNSTLLQELTAELEPTGRFRFTGLTPNTAYAFKLFQIIANARHAVPGGDGAFRTFPPENALVSFSFGLGSCARTRDDAEQIVWRRIASLAPAPGAAPTSARDVVFFVHTGDTFYFYDDVIDADPPHPPNVEAILAAHLSSRKNVNFLSMAKRVPCYAVWDDHDFRGNNGDSTNFNLREQARDTFLRYWGNAEPIHPNFGLSTRFSYGNVDVYLVDGRFNRVKAAGIMFGQAQCQWILEDIRRRGPMRVRVLVSGSTWNHTYGATSDTVEAYGHLVYNTPPYFERETFYAGLSNLLADGKINGLVFASGDIHRNQIYEVALPQGGSRYAPEIVCSPLTNNSLHGSQSIVGERKWSQAQENVGFARIQINTTKQPWTLGVHFIRHDGTVYHTKTFTLQNGQFRF